MEQHSENTVLRRLLTGSAMSMVNMIVGIAIGLIMTPFLLHNLGDRQMGIWAIVGSFTGFYGLLDFGITAAVGRYMTLGFTKNDFRACNSFASIGLFIFMIVGCIAAVISFVIALILYLLYNKTVDDIGLMSLVTIVLGINFMIDFPQRVFSGIITGCFRHDLNNVRQFVFRILGTITTFSIVYYGGNVLSASLGSLFVAIFSGISFYWLAKKVFPQLHLSPQSVRREDFRPLFGYSIITSVAQITDALRFRITGIILAGFLTVDVVAHYTIATTLVGYYLMTLGHCTNWLSTWFTRLHAQNDWDSIRNYMLFAYKVCVYISNFIAFGLIFWSIPFIQRWVGPAYLDCYDALVLLVLGMTFAMWNTVSIKVFYATATHHYYAVINAIDATINVGLTLALVPRYGMTGAAIGNLAAMVVTKLLIQPQAIMYLLKIPQLEFWGNLTNSIARSLLCLVLPFYITQKLIGPEYKWLFLNGIICSVLYFASVYLVGLSKSERQKIIEKLKRK